MKTKLLTLALFGILTLGVAACTNEEIAPSDEIILNEKSSEAGPQGGYLRPR